MNKFDKKLYKALNYFASNNLQTIRHMQKNDFNKFRRFVSIDIELYAFNEEYINIDIGRTHAITTNGLTQLRILENISHNQRTFWTSVTAIVLSIVTFFISLYLNVGGK